MKLKFISLFILLLPFACRAQYNWQALANAPKSWRIDDFFFLNPTLGWATNPHYTGVYPAQYARILKTYDGGNTWQVLKDSATAFYRSVGFADSLTGWIGYLQPGTGADTIPMIETNDGGATWHPARLPQPHPAGICGMSVVTDSVVYAYGTFYGPAGLVKTTDKGATWVYHDMSAYAGGLVDGHFISPDTGFVTGKGADKKALILYTDDGGATWQTVYHSTRIETDIVWKLAFPGGNIAYATIENLSGAAVSTNDYFLKSTDGGLSWTEYPFISAYDEEGIGFINDSVGWIGGDNAKPTYKTTDGGNTWDIDYGFGVLTPPYQDYINYYFPGFVMNRFRRFGDTLMYAGGNTIYKLSTTGNAAGVNELPNQAQGMSNYPNPFDLQTTISFEMPYVSIGVMLDIYDVLGNKVYAKDLGPQNKGIHQYVYNTALPAGVYFYCISTDRFRYEKKMVINH